MFCDISFHFEVNPKTPLDLILLRPSEEEAVLNEANIQFYGSSRLEKLKRVKMVGVWKSLPEIINVEELDCSFCNLKSLPELNKLKKLNCSMNKICFLQNYPNLEELNCSRNKIYQIKDVPKLRILNCSTNNLPDLPEAPLEFLDCHNNPIMEIPDYPNLTWLDCSSTSIEMLPYQFNKKLKRLDARRTSAVNIPMTEIDELFMDMF